LVEHALLFQPSRHSSSEPCGSLPLMASDKPAAATVIDPDGREVLLLARIWEDKITRDHPELVDHLAAVMETVAEPDHVEPDALPDRTRFYRRGAGPSRWLMAVVSYEQQPARIITALANRKDPPRWKP
jgi:hypothetical protein